MKHIILAAAVAAMAGAVSAAEYKPEKWVMDARAKFAEQRFGVFIHWGLYAMYAQGEWYLETGALDETTYSQAMYGFYPSKFDARAWVKTIKGAGAKYLTITSRHHDGFSLWPSKFSGGYDASNTPFRRDILGELAKACEEEGIQLNFYYSLMDWHRPDYPTGRCAAARKSVKGKCENYADYKRFMMGQIGELLDRYHPGNIWFDGEWDHMSRGPKNEHIRFEDDGKGLDWGFDEIYDLIHSKGALVANNNHATIRPKEDIQLFERDLPGENTTGFSGGQTVTRDRPVEQCDVIQEGIWGFKIGGARFLTPAEVCAMLVRAAAKDSNLLMNIGPQADGRLPDRAVEVMAEVGKWMEKNGEAIYGTVGAGYSKAEDGTETCKTRKGDTVYTFTITNGNYPERTK